MSDLYLADTVNPARVARMIHDHDLAERARLAAIRAEQVAANRAREAATRNTRLDRLDAELGDWRARIDAELRRAS